MATPTVWILLTGTVLSGSRAQDCGVASLNTRIVGGVNASAGVWPWQVSVHYSGRHICGGSLISDQWVLTAAHCIVDTSLSFWTLYLGRVTQSGPNPNEVNRTLSQVIVNSDFNNTLFNNDIALMKLSSPVTFTNYIRPICLASSSSQFYNATLCWATGWGRLGKDQPLQAYDRLQEVQIPVIGNNQCTTDYVQNTNVKITDNMMCAGQENKGTCQGDSGGPLQCKQGSVWVQAGITSYGVPCALAGFPEVYAGVDPAQFQTWITDKVSGANVGFVTFCSGGTNQDDSNVCLGTNSTTMTPKQTPATTHVANQTSNTALTPITGLVFIFITVTALMLQIIG